MARMSMKYSRSEFEPNSLKEGDVVKCFLKIGRYNWLTQGGFYTVLEVQDDLIMVIDDNGVKRAYNHIMFEKDLPATRNQLINDILK